MKLDKPLERKHATMILCEGSDEELVVKAILADMGFHGAADVWRCDGQGDIATRLAAALKAPGPTIRRVAIVRDAEDNAADRTKATSDALRKNGLPAPSTSLRVASNEGKRAGFIVVPTGAEAGSLETTCLAAVRFPTVLACVDSMFRCADAAESRTQFNPPTREKARCGAYLAALATTRFYHRCGLGTVADHFDLRHQTFQPLRSFLSELLQ